MTEPAAADAPVAVTGAAGFIGSRLVESLGERGTPVISVDHPRYFAERTEHRGIDYGEVIDRELFLQWLDRPSRELRAIVHLGACTDTTNLDVPYLTRVNLEYSQAIWSWASRYRVPLVYASSGATYGDGSQGYDDDEESIEDLEPLNPYGVSKQQFDVWALDREREGQSPPGWAGFKFFNVYGFGERHKTKMSSVVLQGYDQLRETGRIRLFRSHREGIPDGHQSRDFVAVEDVVNVLHFALDRPIERGIYNLGTGEARTFLDLARAVFAALGRSEEIEFIDTPEVLRPRYQYFTEARMNRLVLGQGYTRPFSTLEEGVARYVRRLQDAGS